MSITVRSSHLCVLFSKKLNRLYAQCTIHEMMPLNGCAEVEETPITAMVWRLQGYKFTLHLMLIIISHSSLLLALGFFSLLSSANHRWRTREALSVNALPPHREVLCPMMPKLYRWRHPDFRHHRGPRWKSRHVAPTQRCSSRATPPGRPLR
jgi:hypothetical protein